MTVLTKPFKPPFRKPFRGPFLVEGVVPIPLTIPDLGKWWDASDLSTISIDVGVDNLADKSGNGLDLGDLSDTQQPDTGIDTINGRNVLTFNGVSPAGDLLLRNGMPTTINSTFLWVGNVISTSNGSDSIFSMDAVGLPNNDLQIDKGNDAGWRGRLTGGGIGTTAIQLPGDIVGLDKILGYQFDTSAGGSAKIRENGVQVASTTYNGLLNTAQNFRLGANRALSQFIPMLFAEMLIYDRALTPTEIATLETYLSDKWGITIP